ncbi:SET and MYND domain-containing protein 4-like [Sarcoptes scabiei]|nr:SET and MYND domain-containing protein 4-like [Sarcoptes scabiei]
MSQQSAERIQFEQSSSGYFGFFLHHQQNLDWFDDNYDRNINYELNPKLFAINEPYLMKTERESLIKMKKQISQIDKAGENQNGSNNSLSNQSKKRKRNLAKKVALMGSNLESQEEQFMAGILIERYLRNNSKNDDNNKNDDIHQSSSRSEIDEKRVLNSVNSKQTESNPEAKTFVDSLFCNRFESLNYRTKLFSNPFYKVIKTKIGLSDFLIPPRCSFAGTDVLDGVKMLINFLKPSNDFSDDDLKVSKQLNASKRVLICNKNPFVLIMDPAWDNNKSVKRKRSYETVSLDFIRRLCSETRILLDLINSIKIKRSNESPKRKISKNPTSIVCGIWTTNLDKQFVLKEMIPLLGLELCCVLKWHKITKQGLPVKVHGGQEYLILAQKRFKNVDETDKQTKFNYKENGLIVSVPSAIHSHKPNIMPIIRKLFCFENDLNLTLPNRHCSVHESQYLKAKPIQTNGHHQNLHHHSDDDQDDYQPQEKNSNHHDDPNQCLITNEFINPLCGLELFARYLQVGFHSIGYECIKLQNEKLFKIF